MFANFAWNEFKSNDINGMIDKLIKYKQQHFPDGSIRLEHLPAVAPHVDSNGEIQLYGLVRMCEREKAIEFLRETRRLFPQKAAKQMKKLASDLGVR